MSKEERLQLENELLLTCSKAQAINNYIDELEENIKLSELWCKSQEEIRKYKEVIDNINLIIKGLAYGGNEDYYMEKFRKINEILKGEDNE